MSVINSGLDNGYCVVEACQSSIVDHVHVPYSTNTCHRNPCMPVHNMYGLCAFTALYERNFRMSIPSIYGSQPRACSDRMCLTPALPDAACRLARQLCSLECPAACCHLLSMCPCICLEQPTSETVSAFCDATASGILKDSQERAAGKKGGAVADIRPQDKW